MHGVGTAISGGEAQAYGSGRLEPNSPLKLNEPSVREDLHFDMFFFVDKNESHDWAAAFLRTNKIKKGLKRFEINVIYLF